MENVQRKKKIIQHSLFSFLFRYNFYEQRFCLCFSIAIRIIITQYTLKS